MLKKAISILLILVLTLSLIPFDSTFANDMQTALNQKEVIIFLHGIMGSELFVTPDLRDKVWFGFNDSRLNLRNTLYPGLPLGWSGWEGDRSSNTRDLLNFYGPFEDFFKDNEKYVVAPFSYDWRETNSKSAIELNRFVEEQKSKNNVNKVHIVAHSMGGLVAKKYILNTKGASVDKFISLGTPYHGSPSAYHQLRKGNILYPLENIVGKIAKFTIADKDLVRSIRSVYELLPNTKYFDRNSGYLGFLNTRNDEIIDQVFWDYSTTMSRLAPVVGDNPRGYLPKAEEFHTSMIESVDKYVDFYRIIGDGIPTDGYYITEEFRYDHFFIFSTSGQRSYTVPVNGDGTVPLLGAKLGKEKTYYTSLQHDKLASDPNVLTAVHQILNNQSVGLRDTICSENDRRIECLGRDFIKVDFYKVYEDELNGEVGPVSVKGNMSTLSVDEEETGLNISIESSLGERFVFEEDQINADNSYRFHYGGDTLTVYLPINDNYSLTFLNENSEANYGIMVWGYEDFSNTRREDFPLINSSQVVLGMISTSNTELGHDTNRDGIIDTVLPSAQLQPINIPHNYVYYDNEVPGDGDQDGGNDDSSHPDINFTLTGTIGINDWYTSDVNISLSTSIEVPIEEPEEGEGNEEEGEPPTELEPKEPIISYALNDGGEKGYSENITVNQDGYHTLSVFISDDEGSLLGQATKSFKIDKTKPELMTQVAAAHGENGWLISDAQISIGATDETSKLARVDYSYNGRGLQGYSGHFNETIEGYHEVSAEAEDNAGNIQTMTTPFKIDKTKPVIADVYLQDEYYWGEDFPISFTTHDDISGVASLTATINGKPVTNGSTYLFTEPGWHDYRIEVKDNAGWKAVYETEFEVYIPATISFRPKQLMLDHGELGMATTYIQLPDPFPLEDLIHSSIELNEHNIHIQDLQYGFVRNPIGFDEEEIDLEKNDYYMIKYNRGSLIDVVEPMDIIHSSGNPNAPDWRNTTIALFGKWGEYHFKGYDSFIVTNKRYNPPPDETKPELESQPVHNQTNVSVEVTPIITFSESVVLSNRLEVTDLTIKGQIQFRDSKGRLVSFTANWMKNTPAIQLNPSLLLLSNETYEITIDEGAFTDLAGNRNEAFTIRFTTENRPITISSPLLVPVIEDEPGAPVQEPGIPSPSYNEPVINAPIIQKQIQLDNSTTQINDTELDQEIRNSSSNIITLSAGENKTKVGLSKKHLKKIVDANKDIQLNINSVAFTINPRDFLVEENTDNYVIFGAEILSGIEKANVLNNSINKEQFLVLGNEVIHLSVSLLHNDQEKAIEIFNNKIKVNVQLPKEAEHAANNGLLWMGRLNPDTNTWEKYAGAFNKSNGTFEFSTEQFSNWTYIVEKRTFQDIGSHWAKEDIEYMANLGYINGLDNLNFAPNQNMTRAQFSKVLADILYLNEISNLPFKDVVDSHWYYESVNKVYTAGIVSGLNSATFAPNEIITREQMAVMIVNALKYLNTDYSLEATEVTQSNEVAIEGYSEVSTWAKESVKILMDKGFIKGKKKGNISHIAPKDYLTRAEGTTLLRYLINN